MILAWMIWSDMVRTSTSSDTTHVFPNIHPLLLVRSHALGEETFQRYRSLLSENADGPFVRASGSERVVLSARNWTLGASLFSSLGP